MPEDATAPVAAEGLRERLIETLIDSWRTDTFRNLRLKAAAHEVRCWECRVTWRSWAQRLVGMKRGHSPKLSRLSRAIVERAQRAEAIVERLQDWTSADRAEHADPLVARGYRMALADADQLLRRRSGARPGTSDAPTEKTDHG